MVRIRGRSTCFVGWRRFPHLSGSRLGEGAGEGQKPPRRHARFGASNLNRARPGGPADYPTIRRLYSLFKTTRAMPAAPLTQGMRCVQLTLRTGAPRSLIPSRPEFGFSWPAAGQEENRVAVGPGGSGSGWICAILQLRPGPPSRAKSSPWPVYRRRDVAVVPRCA